MTVQLNEHLVNAKMGVRTQEFSKGMAEAVELPALFTDEGWRIELVRLMEAPPAPRRDATPPAPTPKG